MQTLKSGAQLQPEIHCGAISKQQDWEKTSQTCEPLNDQHICCSQVSSCGVCMLTEPSQDASSQIERKLRVVSFSMEDE